jgi:hypothetical protein
MSRPHGHVGAAADGNAIGLGQAGARDASPTMATFPPKWRLNRLVLSGHYLRNTGQLGRQPIASVCRCRWA